MLEIFQGWHDPVQTLIACTDGVDSRLYRHAQGYPSDIEAAAEADNLITATGILSPDGIRVNEAWAFRSPVKLSGLIINTKFRNKTWPIGHDLTWPIGGLVAFVGDAGHTLDPILAQGTGLAIEDADHLAVSLKEYLISNNVSRNNSDVDVVMALHDYERRRQARILKLHHFSNFVQSLSHSNSPAFNSIRDLTLLNVSNRLKGYLFDEMIAFSSS